MASKRRWEGNSCLLYFHFSWTSTSWTSKPKARGGYARMPFPSMKYIGMIFQGSKVFTLLEMTLALGWNSQHKRYCVARVLRVATSSLVLHLCPSICTFKVDLHSGQRFSHDEAVSFKLLFPCVLYSSSLKAPNRTSLITPKITKHFSIFIDKFKLPPRTHNQSKALAKRH